MDLIEKRVNELNVILPVKIKLFNLLPSDINPKTYSKLREGAGGWVDPASGDICLYKPNLSSEVNRLDALVTFLGVSRKGIDQFLGERNYKDICFRIGQNLMHGAGDREFVISIGDEYIKSLGDKHTGDWDNIANAVCTVTGMHNDYALAESLCNGNTRHKQHLHKQAVTQRDLSRLENDLQNRMESISTQSNIVSLGVASDVFERIGYPSKEVKIDIESIRKFAESRGLSEESLIKSVFEIHDPIAIIKSHRQKPDGREPNNIFVTSYFIPGHGFLAFGIDSVNDFRKGVVAGRYSSIKIKAMITFSEYSLMQALLSEKGNAIHYLKPKYGKDGSTYIVSDYLIKMEGRSFEELGYKKSAGGTAPSLTSLQQSHRLIMATNIVENFKNPISVEKRIKLLGESKYESMIKASKTDIPAMKQEQTSIVKTKTQRPYKERLYTVLDDHFSKGGLKRLNDRGIFRAMDLISMGEAKLREEFGIRVYKSALSFLDDNGLSFGGNVKIKTIDEYEFNAKTPAEKNKTRETDLIYSLSAVPDNVMARSVTMPRTASGTYFIGANAVSLIAKTVSLPRWRDCNIFLTAKEIEGYGLSVNQGAIPCYLQGKDDSTHIVYNLSETSLASTHPALFDAISQMSRTTSVEVPSYIKNIIYGFKGVSAEDASGIYRFVNTGFKNNVSKEELTPCSMSLHQLSAYSSKQLQVKNPLETRGRKSAKEIYEGFCNGPKQGISSGTKKKH